ncbi:hypothetical protein GCM10023185_13400 [Hymenobacter saemangeumensis]|uniref:D-alanyl-D-alanine carboxypeptidase-like core domain-containing protein n=1 Tax=Hymenobacter saemangeumensis TaxID=1084522 RepID=A0ABP8I8A9_9BACT
MNTVAAYFRQIPRAVLVAVAAAVGLAVLVRQRLTRFDAETEAKLAQLTPAARAKFRTFLEAARERGWQVVFVSGYRTYAQQAALHAANPRNAAAPGHSSHETREAGDLNFIHSRTGAELRKGTSKIRWQASGLVYDAAAAGLTWGGPFGDNNHFSARS